MSFCPKIEQHAACFPLSLPAVPFSSHFRDGSLADLNPEDEKMRIKMALSIMGIGMGKREIFWDLKKGILASLHHKKVCWTHLKG